jgi:putative permease
MKRLMLYTAVILGTIAVLFLLWQFRFVLLLFILSLSVAAMFRPFIESLMKRGVPRAGAQLLVYLAVAGGLGLFTLVAGNSVLNELNEAANNSIIDYEQFHRRWDEGAAWQQAIVGRLPQPFALDELRDTELGQMLPSIITVTSGAISLIVAALLILALGLYWSVDQVHFERLWLSLLPAQRRAYARDNWRDMEASIGKYLRSQTAQSLLAALALGITAWLVGYPYPILLALLGAIGAFIPLFGGVLTALLALWLGSSQSTGMAIGIAVYILLVFLFLELFIEPRLWPRERRSFLLTLLIIIPMVDAFGIWGLLAAPLLAAVLETIIRHSYQRILTGRKEKIDLEELITRHGQLASRFTADADGDLPPELQNLNQRLAALLAESQAATEKKHGVLQTSGLQSEPGL